MRNGQPSTWARSPAFGDGCGKKSTICGAGKPCTTSLLQRRKEVTMTHTAQHPVSLKPGWTVSGVVEAPVEQVWPLLLENFSSVGLDKNTVEAYSGSQPYITSIGK